MELPTCLVCLKPKKLKAHIIEEWLRDNEIPIIVRVENDQVLLDVRTIQDRELKSVAEAISHLATK